MKGERLKYSSNIGMEVSFKEMERYLVGALERERRKGFDLVVNKELSRGEAERGVRVVEAILELVREEESPRLL